jgi:predicted permease
MAVLGLILLLACTNVTNLLLAGAIARQREVGLRLALGASRGRVVRQLLTESLMLGALAGGVGLFCARWLLPIVARALDAPDTIDVAVDVRVYGFVFAATLLAGLVSGLAPARYGARGNLAAPLKGAAGGRAGGKPGRTRSALVGVQAAASIMLLVLAALLARSMIQVVRIDLGFDIDGVLAVTPEFRAGGYDAARAADYWDRVVDRVSGLPGVEHVAVANYPPFALGGGYGPGFPLERDAQGSWAFFHNTSANYFATVGIPLVRGRTYGAEEVAIGAPVAVISESLARRVWGADEALGATLERVHQRLADVRVIGIVGDAVTNRPQIEQPDPASFYQPLAPADSLTGKLVVRARGDAAMIVGPVLEAVRALDPQVLPTAVTLRDGFREAQGPLRILATTTGILGAIALGLAFIGVFGLTAFAVEQRMGEIGVRIAVGASSGDVVRLMLRDNLRPVAAGLVFGLLLAIAASRLLTAVLYGISPHDPPSIAAAVAVLLGAAALAAAVPTRRATRVDPAVVLRSE